MNITKTDFVVFDVETTGLSSKQGDKIIEIAAIKVQAGKIVGTFEQLINPMRDIPIEAQRINNISNDMVRNEPTADEVLPKVLDFIGSSCLVAHNIKFDLDFLAFELSAIGRKLNDAIPAVDTLKMAKACLPQLRTYRLSNLAMYFGVQFDETHRALADVQITVSVFHHLLELLKPQGLDDLRELTKQYGVQKPTFKIQEINQPTLF